METGVVTMFAGTILQIPTGWALCDGNYGTPDLRDKFVLGAGLTFAVGAEGGVTVHNHAFTGDGHDHTLSIGAGVAGGATYSATTESDPATGTTDNGGSLPPYYSLAYTMKL